MPSSTVWGADFSATQSKDTENLTAWHKNYRPLETFRSMHGRDGDALRRQMSEGHRPSIARSLTGLSS